MFTQLKYFTPTGSPIPLPLTANNLQSYNQYVRKRLVRDHHFKLAKTKLSQQYHELNTRWSELQETKVDGESIVSVNFAARPLNLESLAAGQRAE